MTLASRDPIRKVKHLPGTEYFGAAQLVYFTGTFSGRLVYYDPYIESSE